MSRAERLEWFVRTLQEALGISTKTNLTGRIQDGPLRLTVRMTISNGALIDLLRRREIRISLAEQVRDQVLEDLEEWSRTATLDGTDTATGMT